MSTHPDVQHLQDKQIMKMETADIDPTGCAFLRCTKKIALKNKRAYDAYNQDITPVNTLSPSQCVYTPSETKQHLLFHSKTVSLPGTFLTNITGDICMHMSEYAHKLKTKGAA